MRRAGKHASAHEPGLKPGRVGFRDIADTGLLRWTVEMRMLDRRIFVGFAMCPSFGIICGHCRPFAHAAFASECRASWV